MCASEENTSQDKPLYIIPASVSQVLLEYQCFMLQFWVLQKCHFLLTVSILIIHKKKQRYFVIKNISFDFLSRFNLLIKSKLAQIYLLKC